MVRIKCPNCKALLEIKNKAEESEKIVVCPSCKKQIRLVFRKTAVKTPLEKSNNHSEGETQLPEEKEINKSCFLLFEGHRYPLSLGNNTVGRKANEGNADVQIVTADRYMSRQHIIIIVKRKLDGSVKSEIKNYKNKNETEVNHVPLNEGDVIVLHDGDIIKLGDTELTFKYSTENT